MFKLPFWGSNRTRNSLQKTAEGPSFKLVVGLGNPGDKYADTYHNAGFLYLDYLTRGEPARFKKYRDFAFVRRDELILVKPLTLMNRSGLAVKQALKYFNLAPDQMVVAHDDSDLELGKYKTAFGRGGAGHKGVQSVIDHLGAGDFHRIRIGIRKIEGKAGSFVLKRISKNDLAVLKRLFREIKVHHLGV